MQNRTKWQTANEFYDAPWSNPVLFQVGPHPNSRGKYRQCSVNIAVHENGIEPGKLRTRILDTTVIGATAVLRLYGRWFTGYGRNTGCKAPVDKQNVTYGDSCECNATFSSSTRTKFIQWNCQLMRLLLYFFYFSPDCDHTHISCSGLWNAVPRDASYAVILYWE
jgi:hypothetical protein